MNKTFLEQIEHRNCPLCGNSTSSKEFSLYSSQFLGVNPTHNKSWFDVLKIPDDYEFDYLKCDKCGVLYTSIYMKEELNHDYYNNGILAELSKAKIFKGEKRRNQINLWSHLHELAMTELPSADTLNIIDYGAGWGDFLAISKSFGVSCTGLEYDQRKIAFAKVNGLVVGDIELVENRGPYNVFVCNQVLEHLLDPIGAMNHLNSILVSGAIGYLSVPNFNQQRIGAVKQKAINNEKVDKDVCPFDHINYFAPEHLSIIADKTGFEVLPLNYGESKQEAGEAFMRFLSPKVSKRLHLKGTSLFLRKKN